MSKAEIVGNEIVIRLAIDAIPSAVEMAWAMGAMAVRYKVPDATAFAEDFVHELNREDEQGTTPIHMLFDKCLNEAIAQGAQGIEEHDVQEF